MARKSTPKKVTLKKPVIRRSSQAASKKPVVTVGTLVTLIVFSSLILFGLVINRQKETTTAETTPTKGISYIFNGSDGLVSSIEVKPKEGETVKLTRDVKNIWVFELPKTEPADQGAVEAAASQALALQVVTTLPADAKPSTFGFDTSAYTITLKFSNGKTRVLEVGDATPTNSGYYVRVDKGSIMVADLNGVGALTQLADFPPYLPTATPEAITTPTP